MNIPRQKLKFFALVGLVFIAVLGVYLPNINKSLNNTLECVLTENNCLFGDQNLALAINFSQTPIIEEELAIQFTFANSHKIQSAWVEGVNMYMGKTPVLFEQLIDNPQNAGLVVQHNADTQNSLEDVTLQKQEGITFLGACSSAQMHWQLKVILIESGTKNTALYTANFYTTQ